LACFCSEALIIQYDLLVLYMRSEQYDSAIKYCQHVLDDLAARPPVGSESADLKVVRLLMNIQALLYSTRVMGLKIHAARLHGHAPTSAQFKEIVERLSRCEREFDNDAALLRTLPDNSALKFESIALKRAFESRLTISPALHLITLSC
jgi:hypothetical protein